MLPHPPGAGHGRSQQCTFIQVSSNPTQLSTLRHRMCGDLQVFSSARSVDPLPPKGFLSHPETHSYAPFIALNIFPQQFQCLFFIRLSHSLPQSFLIILSSFVLSERSAFLQIPLKSLYHYHPLVLVSNASHFFIRSPRKDFFLMSPPSCFPLCPFWWPAPPPCVRYRSCSTGNPKVNSQTTDNVYSLWKSIHLRNK